MLSGPMAMLPDYCNAILKFQLWKWYAIFILFGKGKRNWTDFHYMSSTEAFSISISNSEPGSQMPIKESAQRGQGPIEKYFCKNPQVWKNILKLRGKKIKTFQMSTCLCKISAAILDYLNNYGCHSSTTQSEVRWSRKRSGKAGREKWY